MAHFLSHFCNEYISWSQREAWDRRQSEARHSRKVTPFLPPSRPNATVRTAHPVRAVGRTNDADGSSTDAQPPMVQQRTGGSQEVMGTIGILYVAGGGGGPEKTPPPLANEREQ